MDPGATVKITDFGLAKLYSSLDSCRGTEALIRADPEARKESGRALHEKYEVRHHLNKFF